MTPCPATLLRRAWYMRPAWRHTRAATRTPRRFAHSEDRPPYARAESVGDKRFSPFDLGGKVFVVTGGGRGLGLTLAEGLVEAGAKVHCLDRSSEPDAAFVRAEESVRDKRGGGRRLEYHQVDVTHDDQLEAVISDIAADKQRLDGLLAAAGIQKVSSALEYAPDDIAKMLQVNYTGVFLAARASARQMFRYKTQGSMCLIASMSGSIANRGFLAPVYNSSKAAVVQLAKNLAMEWGRQNPDGSGGIRVNSLSPGHIVTPMVEENFRRGEADRAEWEENSMLGRLSTPEEYQTATLFLLSRASSYMTGANLIMDGGTTAW